MINAFWQLRPSIPIMEAFLISTSIVALAEMGDKTQLATVGLAAKYPLSYYWVVAGTTLGMMLANAPVVWFGEKITKKLPIKTIHRVCAVIFLVLGVAALLTKV